MLLNVTTAVSTPAILLVPYGEHHVLRYHEWMKSPDLQELTASEPLTLEEEYAMQRSWQTDYDKLTFIACHPVPRPVSEGAEGVPKDGIVASQGYDVPEKMIGDVNLFLRLAYELDAEGEEMLDRPYVRGEIELMIASPSDQGRGFGKATLLAFLQYIKNHAVDILDQYKSHAPNETDNHTQLGDAEMGGLVLVSKINKSNLKSRGLFESVGFAQVGKEDYFGEIELKLTEGMGSLKPRCCGQRTDVGHRTICLWETGINDHERDKGFGFWCESERLLAQEMISPTGHETRAVHFTVLLTVCTFLLTKRCRNVPPLSALDGPTAVEKGGIKGFNYSQNPLTALGHVEQLDGFDWKTTEPLKHRPFKPKYHLTMALQKTDVNNVIIMDKNYLDRVTLRQKAIAEYPSTMVGHLEGSRPAVEELYKFLFDRLLPVRWPQMFQRSNESSTEALNHIGSNLDEDFLMLLPSDDGDGYTMKAFATCFASGFDASEKLGLKLRDIHGPVPKYMNILNKSMDRYFSALEVGKFKRRLNWTVVTNDKLVTPFEITHFHDGKHTSADHTGGVEVENTYQRTEMQSLFRLPQSGAIVFTIKTYMYPIQEVKDEGYGEEMATAIEGLQTGNVPEMFFYKRGPIWGDRVQSCKILSVDEVWRVGGFNKGRDGGPNVTNQQLAQGEPILSTLPAPRAGLLEGESFASDRSHLLQA
ncbi:hypothetical protein O988_02539 [Pseudogymnoascus sp. VKM F-3808]|nr:hypothetical protein O988_02539 [Pseudogymnoascus sp. VKM F-3808]